MDNLDLDQRFPEPPGAPPLASAEQREARREPHLIDLSPWLPPLWASGLREAAQHARHVTTDGPGPGSIGSLGGRHAAGLDYWTLQGAELTELCPWLESIYADVLPILCRLAGDGWVRPVTGSHGVSLNRLSADSHRPGLEWHVDGLDVERTIILTPDSWGGETGGRFLTHDGDAVTPWALPSDGQVLSVATGVTPHAVEPIDWMDGDPSRTRITVMFSYTDAAKAHLRTAEQDAYIGVVKDPA